MVTLTTNVYAIGTVSDLSQIENRLNALEDSIDYSGRSNYIDELIEIKAVIEQQKPLPIYQYVQCNVYLSQIYIHNGEFDKADKILNHAFVIINENGFKNDANIRFLYFTQGLLWFNVGNNDLAGESLEKAKGMFEQEGEMSVDYALCLMNLSTIYHECKDFALSYLYLESARELFENNLNDSSEQKLGAHLYILNNLGRQYLQSRQFEKAEALFQKVINKSDNNELFKDIHTLATINLCQLYCMKGNYNEVLSLSTEKLVSTNDFRLKELLYQNIIFSESNLKSENSSLEKRLNDYNDLVINHTYDLFSNFSTREIESYWTNQSQALILVNNYAAYKSNNPPIVSLAYDNAVYTKSFLLKFNSIIPLLATSSGNTSLINANNEISKLKNKLDDKNTPTDSIVFVLNRINFLEKEIIKSIPDIKTTVEEEIPSFSQIQKSMDKKDVAIEFVLLPDLSSLSNIKFYYGALILKKDYQYPLIVKLCNMDEFDSFLDEKTILNKDEVNMLFALDNDSIYQLIWKPLDSYINKGDNIYYSPSGEINKINISALSNGKKRLMDIYNIHEVITTGNIPEIKAAKNTNYNTALLYGGIDYSESPEAMSQQSTKIRNTFADFLATRSIDSRGNWGYLAATGYEAAQIDMILRDHNVKTLLLSGVAANEESFKSLSGKAPDIMHIATHGFFLPEPQKRKSPFFNNIVSFTQKNESLFYSGLLFAGANNTWNGVNILPEVEDGILTADEVSRIDLSNCKLVVLSACNTGLGSVDVVDGVFGLQRGFKQAGVGSIIMSLWKVDDNATAELMIAFYQLLNKGHNAHDALELAKKKLIKDKRFSDPYYWAAFVLLD